MASNPITAWQRDGETMETVTDFIFMAPKSLQMVTASMKSKKPFRYLEKCFKSWLAVTAGRRPLWSTGAQLCPLWRLWAGGARACGRAFQRGGPSGRTQPGHAVVQQRSAWHCKVALLHLSIPTWPFLYTKQILQDSESNFNISGSLILFLCFVGIRILTMSADSVGLMRLLNPCSSFAFICWRKWIVSS